MHVINYAQNNVDSSLYIKRNYILGNISFDGITLNYERNIFNWSVSQSNIRTGLGLFNDLQGGGKQGIVSLVQLFGKRNSHFEIVLGIRYLVNGRNNESPSEKYFCRDQFIGYRYEKPDGKFIFRTGYIYPSIYAMTIGLGIKF